MDTMRFAGKPFNWSGTYFGTDVVEHAGVSAVMNTHDEGNGRVEEVE